MAPRIFMDQPDPRYPPTWAHIFAGGVSLRAELSVGDDLVGRDLSMGFDWYDITLECGDLRIFAGDGVALSPHAKATRQRFARDLIERVDKLDWPHDDDYEPAFDAGTMAAWREALRDLALRIVTAPPEAAAGLAERPARPVAIQPLV